MNEVHVRPVLRGPNVHGRSGIQNLAHPFPTNGDLHFDHRYLFGARICHRQTLKPSAGNEPIMDKVCITMLLRKF